MKYLDSFENYSSLKVSLDDEKKMKIDIGDEIKGGKFKNKKIKVKKIDINAKNDIVINDKPFSKFRTNEAISKRNNNLLINKPKEGDLVVGFITARKGWNPDLKWYLNNTVAEVESHKQHDNYGEYYTLKYDNIPKGFEENFTKFPSDNHYFRMFAPSEIRFATPKEKNEYLINKKSREFNL